MMKKSLVFAGATFLTVTTTALAATTYTTPNSQAMQIVMVASNGDRTVQQFNHSAQSTAGWIAQIGNQCTIYGEFTRQTYSIRANLFNTANRDKYCNTNAFFVYVDANPGHWQNPNSTRTLGTLTAQKIGTQECNFISKYDQNDSFVWATKTVTGTCTKTSSTTYSCQ